MDFRELELLSTISARELLDRLDGRPPDECALLLRGKTPIPSDILARQLTCRLKARSKLPTLSRAGMLYEPTALEQASGEVAAAFHASVLNADSVADLTGGLGIDTIFFRRRTDRVCYVEADPVLAQLFRTNAETLGIEVDILREDGAVAASRFDSDEFDALYLDPSRRMEGRRTVSLRMSRPNVEEYLETFLTKAREVWVKAAPAYEPVEAARHLRNLHSFLVVSVDGECKESLLRITRQVPEMVCHSAVVLNSRACPRIFSGTPGSARRFCDSAEYLLVPDPAIRRARLSAAVADQFGLCHLNQSVDYLVSDHPVEDFPGKTYHIREQMKWNRNRVKQYLRSSKMSGAGVSRRDFPMSSKELSKMFSLREADTDQLFFTRDLAGDKIFIHGRLVSPNKLVCGPGADMAY